MEVVGHGGGRLWRWWTMKVVDCGGGGGLWRWWTMEVVVDHGGGGPWRWWTMEVVDHGGVVYLQQLRRYR